MHWWAVKSAWVVSSAASGLSLGTTWMVLASDIILEGSGCLI